MITTADVAPVNLVVRFATELTALTALGFWGWDRRHHRAGARRRFRGRRRAQHRVDVRMDATADRLTG